ncbi:hypothetical protein CSC2_03460 [Clostridium zeae]|uniref:DUF4261 domain-containing protein n=1 Tax=Clostridium zeae TaxID=2759022 RepID=A0ABQ1E4Z7_9CLOT|nr:hypothetical protein [Clostridium zeae]GFZ29820.1 hypothetical protein CSC2_03460 [Clostridium zeae]
MFDLFKKKNKKKEELVENIVQEFASDEVKLVEEKESPFALYLLFSKQFVLRKDEVERRIKGINNDIVTVGTVADFDGKDALYFYAEINEHRFKLIGIETPIPDEIASYTINCSYGNEIELRKMKEHSYHVIAFYEGKCTDKNKVFNAYSKLAYGLLEHGLLGMANPYSWNCIIPSLIKGMVEDESAKILATMPAMMVWRNFIKMPYKDGVWFVTKGNNLYDIYEYAYFGVFEDSNEVYEIFESIFNYVYDTKSAILSGHTMQIDKDVYLRFREVYELENDLQGEGIGTLVIEKIRSNEINMIN